MRYLTILAFSLLLLPASLGAQMRSQSRGFMLNLHALASSVKGEDWNKSEGGGGLGLTLAYGFSPKVMVLLAADVADVTPKIGDPYVLGLGDLGVRYTFANSRKAFIPYVQGAFTVLTITYEDVPNAADYEILGPALTLAGGASYYLSRAFAIEFGIGFSAGKFNSQKSNGSDPTPLGADEFKATSGRINAGISWHPSKKPN